jgi:dihydroorotate dehydrogenase electron transfer subunit
MMINLMQIKEHTEVIAGSRRLVLAGMLKAHPGQFVQVAVSKTHDPLLRRPLSIHACTDDTTVLLYRVCGRGTTLLSEKKPGETLDVLGPLGRGFPLHHDKEAILVAGGMGIAPLYHLASVLAENSKKVYFYAGAKNSRELYVPEGLKEIAFSLVLATDDGSTGHHGLVTEAVAAIIREKAAPVYCCGPLPMMQEVNRLASDCGREIFVSLEAGMACGVGACQGCVTPVRSGTSAYSRVCADGPVFRGEEVFFDEA